MQIKEILIQTSRLHSVKEFYESVLKLKIESRGDSSISIGIGRSSLLIEETSAGNPFYHFAINIPANKIEESRSWLLNKVELLWMEDYKSDIADNQQPTLNFQAQTANHRYLPSENIK